jgi:peptidylprolyl isomerase
MAQAKTGDTVKIHYTGTLDDGTQFDSSVGRDPLEFTLGSGQVIPGFDKAVEGMAVGESKQVRLEPADAYGKHHEQLVQTVERAELPDEIAPEIGMRLQSEDPSGQVIEFTITEVTEVTITVDANHPLAGQALNFDVELTAIA